MRSTPLALVVAVATSVTAFGTAHADEPATAAANPPAVATPRKIDPNAVTPSAGGETRLGAGTPGMILGQTMDGDRPIKVWDPARAWTTGKRPRYEPSAGWRVLIPSTVPTSISGRVGDKETFFGMLPSARWSPDGTRVAYMKAVADSGIARNPFSGERVTHTTAIFVYDLLTQQSRQVTFPPAGTRFCEPDDEFDGPPCDPDLGHLFYDSDPHWTADSSRIVFVRFGHTGYEDSMRNDSGYNYWSVPASGGTAVNLTRWDEDSDFSAEGDMAPIPGTSDMIVKVLNAYETDELRRVSATASGGSGQVLVSTDSFGRLSLTDFGVSPDGSELVYGMAPSSQSGLGKAVVVPLNGKGRARTIGQWPGSLARFSPTGNGILRAGCVERNDGKACGITEFLLDDDGSHDNGLDDERLVYRSDELYQFALAPISGVRPGLDIQTQQLPVVFLPGFAGSELQCNGSVVWLNPKIRVTGLDELELGANGRSNANCPSAGPTGKLVEYVVGSYGDVYGPAADFVRQSFDGRGSVFGWDWRKSPKDSLDLLERHIDNVLQQERYRKQGVKRVTLYGHSYGGLFIRQFINTNPQLVARVLTAGTPYWGAPKAIFPLLFGLESPVESELDALLPDGDFASLARNLTGMYQLFPAGAFGDWLSVDGKTMSMDGVAFLVDGHQGNRRLLNKSYRDRTQMYEGFEDMGGVIDYRAVAGTGLPAVDEVRMFFPTAAGDDEVKLLLTLTDGDGTVTDRSASQQKKPNGATLGAPVHVQRVCGVSHMALAGHPQVTQAYEEFLDTGRLPLKSNGCRKGAKKREVTLTLVQ